MQHYCMYTHPKNWSLSSCNMCKWSVAITDRCRSCGCICGGVFISVRKCSFSSSILIEDRDIRMRYSRSRIYSFRWEHIQGYKILRWSWQYPCDIYKRWWCYGTWSTSTRWLSGFCWQARFFASSLTHFFVSYLFLGLSSYAQRSWSMYHTIHYILSSKFSSPLHE